LPLVSTIFLLDFGSVLTVWCILQDEYIFFHKQPTRRGFDYAIVNAAMFLRFKDNSNVVTDCRICVGNVDKKPFLLVQASAAFTGK
jgi:CO/xanthine dehydrogenase FAD-binding subunit